MRWMAAILGVLLISVPALGEVVCVAKETSYLKELPALASPRVVLEVPRYYPLFVTDSEEGFYEVGDYWGRKGWIEAGAVDRTGCAVVAREGVNVRGGAGVSNPVVMKARAGVAFRVMELNHEWAHVRHETGREGWVHRGLLWGTE